MQYTFCQKLLQILLLQMRTSKGSDETYCKNPKNLNTQKIAVIILKFKLCF